MFNNSITIIIIIISLAGPGRRRWPQRGEAHEALAHSRRPALPPLWSRQRLREHSPEACSRSMNSLLDSVPEAAAAGRAAQGVRRVRLRVVQRVNMPIPCSTALQQK